MLPPTASDLIAIEHFTTAHYATFAVSVAINAVAFWLTMRHSTPAAAKFRYFLLCVQIPSFIADVAGSLSSPVILIPTICAFTDGIGGGAVQSTIGAYGLIATATIVIAGCAFCVCAHLTCLFYRNQAVLMPSSRMKLNKNQQLKLLACALVMYAMPSIIFMFSAMSTSRRSEYIADNYEGWPQHLVNRLVCIEPLGIVFFSVAMTVVVYVSVKAQVIFIFHTLRALNSNRVMSKMTARYHRQMTQALAIQCIVSNIAFTTPCLIMTGQVVTKYANIVLTISAFDLLCLHSSLHCITLVASTPSYRRAIITMFRCHIRVATHVQHSPLASTY